jgi:tyrosyl-tRNA synthetase
MPEIALTEPTNIVELMTREGLASSKSEARRLIQQSAVRLDGQTVQDVNQIVQPHSGSVLNVGKHKFVRLKA